MFDGRLERPLLALTPEERLDWIWATMELVALARPLAVAGADRGRRAEPAPPSGDERSQP